MKNIILGGLMVVAMGFGVHAYAAPVKQAVLLFVKPWAQVQGTMNVDMYRTIDDEKGVTCYLAFIAGNANTIPQISCVKTK